MSESELNICLKRHTSAFQYTSNTGYQGLANQANALPRSSSGLEYKIVRLDKRGSKKNGFVYYPIINVGAIRFEVDIENALTAGEVQIPGYVNPKNPSQNSNSVADELKKLKDLYDSGAITKEEYDAAKKKLLQ